MKSKPEGAARRGHALLMNYLVRYQYSKGTIDGRQGGTYGQVYEFLNQEILPCEVSKGRDFILFDRAIPLRLEMPQLGRLSDRLFPSDEGVPCVGLSWLPPTCSFPPQLR